MKSGKLFERQFKLSCKKDPELFYYRMKDSPSAWGEGENSILRFTNDNICDLILFKTPVFFLIELKTHSGSSLPFSCIRKNQIDGLIDSSKYEKIVPGIICYFSDKSRCFFLHIQKLKELIDSNTRKSVPIKYFEEHGIEIPVKKLKVNFLVDVQGFVQGFIEDK